MSGPGDDSPTRSDRRLLTAAAGAAGPRATPGGPGKRTVGPRLPLNALLALLCAAAIALCALTPTAAAARNVRVGTWSYPPQVFIDESGKPAGIFIDIVEYLAAENDWTVTYVHGTWEDTLDRLEHGKIDLGLGVGQARPRREQFYLNAEPVVSDWGQIYTRKGERIETLLDLQGKRVVGWRDDRTFQALQELAIKLGVRASYQSTNSVDENFGMVSRGEADAVVELHIPGTIYQKKYGLVASPLVFNPITFGFGTTKGSNVDLIQAIDAYLRAGKDDPDSHYQRTLDKWLGAATPETRWRVPQYLLVAFGVVAGVAALLVGMSILLRRQVRRRTTALRESQARYQALVEHAPVAVFVNDNDRVTLANKACLRLFGASSPEDLLGKSPYELFHPDCHHLIRERIHQLRDLGRPVALVEEKIVRLDGVPVDVEVAAAPFRDGDTNAIHVVLLDITERKQAAAALDASAAQLHEALHDTVRALGEIVSLRDPYTADHERRVTRLADAIAAEMGLDEQRREGLTFAGEVHDIGKVGVPAEILTKPGKLTEMEYALVRQHAERGYEVLAAIAFQWPVAEMVRQHHERLDGSGYPRGLKGDEIMLEARILAVADVVEAMSSHRPYRPALGMDDALAEVRAGAGTLFDADVVAACERVIAAGLDLS